MDPQVSIVIPNFNGRRLMARHLPSVMAALTAYPPGGEVIVVDDGSADDSVSWLRESMAEIRLITLAENRGFSFACTAGINEAAHDILLLLNTDVQPQPGFIQPLVNALSQDEVFAAGSLALEEDGITAAENIKIPRMSMGKLMYDKLRKVDLKTCRRLMPDSVPTLFTTGGFMAMKKSLFLDFGGFDPLFKPFYTEDVDLCYRAWKRGYRVLLVTESVVIHQHEGAILKHHDLRAVRRIQERNRILLLWKNLTAPRLFLFGHLAPLLLRSLLKWLFLDFDFYRALWGALGKLPIALAARRREKRAARKTDGEIFATIRKAARHVMNRS